MVAMLCTGSGEAVLKKEPSPRVRAMNLVISPERSALLHGMFPTPAFIFFPHALIQISTVVAQVLGPVIIS